MTTIEEMRKVIPSPVYLCQDCDNDTNCHIPEEMFWVEIRNGFCCEMCSYEYYGVRERTTTLAEVIATETSE